VSVRTDFNGAEQEGFGRFDHTVRDGVRCSTSLAFLEPARRRPNLTIAANATVLGLVLEGTAVRGVRYAQDGGERVAHADREVVLCAGAVGSPHLLMLSGIGPADHLLERGVSVAMDLPGVGSNLQDHLLTVVQYETLGKGSQRLTLPRLLWWMTHYAATGQGAISQSPLEAGAFIRTRPDLRRPDLQFHFVPFGVDRPNTDEKRDPPVGRFFGFLPSLIYPRSRGTIRLGTSDPLAAPRIDPHYLEEAADLDLLVHGVELSREIANTPPLAQFRGNEVTPGPLVKTDTELRASIRTRLNTIFHPVGTCKMGIDREAVVDPELRVRGVTGLRVADAS
jgi:choline dehydrogenase